jgi:hypothetical protein
MLAAKPPAWVPVPAVSTIAAATDAARTAVAARTGA